MNEDQDRLEALYAWLRTPLYEDPSVCPPSGRLAAHVAGRLDAVEKGAVAEHIAGGCPLCVPQFEALQAEWRAFGEGHDAAFDAAWREVTSADAAPAAPGTRVRLELRKALRVAGRLREALDLALGELEAALSGSQQPRDLAFTPGRRAAGEAPTLTATRSGGSEGPEGARFSVLDQVVRPNGRVEIELVTEHPDIVAAAPGTWVLHTTLRTTAADLVLPAAEIDDGGLVTVGGWLPPGRAAAGLPLDRVVLLVERRA